MFLYHSTVGAFIMATGQYSTVQYSTVQYGTEQPDPACVTTANMICVVYTGVVPNSAPSQIITPPPPPPPLVLVGLGLGVGVRLGLGNHKAILMAGGGGGGDLGNQTSVKFDL